jgi:hypothetical protein
MTRGLEKVTTKLWIFKWIVYLWYEYFQFSLFAEYGKLVRQKLKCDGSEWQGHFFSREEEQRSSETQKFQVPLTVAQSKKDQNF